MVLREGRRPLHIVCLTGHIIETHNATWSGIALTIRFERVWLGFACHYTSYLEVESTPRTKLPLSDRRHVSGGKWPKL